MRVQKLNGDGAVIYKNDMFDKKTILVTGGTGTFGHAFVSRLISIPEVKKIIVFSRDEYKQSEMQRSIRDPRLRYFIGDIRDKDRLYRAFHGVDIVVHAAALKQVPTLEYNPFEAIKTNVTGTQNVIDAALDTNIEKVLFISSDKAVQPINLYGASKLCAERLWIAANFYRFEKDTQKFSVVRYGNVLGSRGSLIELIKTQKPSGTITLTDKEMTRFWITVDEVMNIVLHALETMQGGEIFIPKMKSTKVVDVIKTLAPECEVKTVGIRPGEKMHEILITEFEAKRTKDIGKMYVILPEFATPNLQNKLAKMYGKKTLFPANVPYASNHKNFLLSAKKVKQILGKLDLIK